MSQHPFSSFDWYGRFFVLELFSNFDVVPHPDRPVGGSKLPLFWLFILHEIWITEFCDLTKLSEKMYYIQLS